LNFTQTSFLSRIGTRRTLWLRGLVERGCISFLPQHQSKFLESIKSLDRWHSRLGHPSFPIVEKVLRNHKLPFVSKLNKDVVCDACQRGKVINYPILFLQVSPLNHLNSFFLMCGRCS
jgi:hypothetical protein